MKITRNRLRRLIKEELGHLLEQVAPVAPGAMSYESWHESMMAHEDLEKMVGVGVGHTSDQAAYHAEQDAVNAIEAAGKIVTGDPAEVIGTRRGGFDAPGGDDRIAVAVTLRYADREMVIR